MARCSSRCSRLRVAWQCWAEGQDSVNGPWTGWDPPEGVAGWSDFHWWKVPAGRVLQLIILSDVPLGYSGHFLKGRMQPCQGEDCQACHEGTGAQLRYLFAAVEPTTRRVGIWDTSRAVAQELRDRMIARGGLRGMWLVLSHHSHSKQSRTEIEGVESALPGWFADMESPDVTRALVETWRKAGYPIPAGYDLKPERRAGKNQIATKISLSLKGPSGSRQTGNKASI